MTDTLIPRESTSSKNLESAVRDRYAEASKAREEALCCPVDYDPKYLEIIPDEVLERDYGCGDPSQFLNPGETVLDLGSGGGKICFIAAQVVGEKGKVIGVDFGKDMLDLARSAQPTVAERLGFDNVEFRRGRIQDLGLDLDLLDTELQTNPVSDASSYLELQSLADRLRSEKPLVADDSVDVVVSNCVLNLVQPQDKASLFKEMFRVLHRGGRVVISDIVSDEVVPEHLVQDQKLYSGCISGAFTETGFLQAFEHAGFYGIEILKRDQKPWATVEGIEFRSVTVRAYKGKQGPCWERHQAVVYNGPWKAVMDDDGHTLYRGERMAVCDKTYNIYRSEPYNTQITPIDPYETVPMDEAKSFDCTTDAKRPARASKGLDYSVTMEPAGEACGPDGDCC